MGGKAEFGARLRALRQSRGLTQEVLAERAGVSSVTIGQIERGAADPRLGTVEALAEALEVSPPELLAAGPPDGGWVAVSGALYDLVRRAAASEPRTRQLVERVIRAVLPE